MRRLTVALSRARLGLYILGRREVFESCYELQEGFSRLLARPDKLKLVVGEMYPATRAIDAAVDETEMDGVEHLGKYVYEITQAKIASLKAGGEVLQPVEKRIARDDEDEDEGVAGGGDGEGVSDDDGEEEIDEA
jgi:intron-binding protein aquarius